MNPSEFEDSYEDKQKIRGAVVTEPIAALHPKPVATVRPNTTVFDAVHLMTAKKIGCVCVTEADRPDKLIGIFTERDVLRKVVQPGLDAKKTPVSEVMTKNPETLTAKDRMAFALNKMHVGGYRHIPIVDGNKLTGIISIRDIADFIVEMFPEGVLNVPPEPKLGIPTKPEGA
jgi:CBS domain-containing protein